MEAFKVVPTSSQNCAAHFNQGRSALYETLRAVTSFSSFIRGCVSESTGQEAPPELYRTEQGLSSLRDGVSAIAIVGNLLNLLSGTYKGMTNCLHRAAEVFLVVGRALNFVDWLGRQGAYSLHSKTLGDITVSAYTAAQTLSFVDAVSEWFALKETPNQDQKKYRKEEEKRAFALASNTLEMGTMWVELGVIVTRSPLAQIIASLFIFISSAVNLARAWHYS